MLICYCSGDRLKEYTFSRVFSGDTSQSLFFESTTAPFVRQAFAQRKAAGEESTSLGPHFVFLVRGCAIRPTIG